MGRPKLEKLIRYRLFRNWWARKLRNRPNKLYDYDTGKKMSEEKRLLLEKPKVDDFFDFFLSMGIYDFDLSWDKKREEFRFELFKVEIPLRIVTRGIPATLVIEKAVLQFLDTKVK